jgi:hypothetical protein
MQSLLPPSILQNNRAVYLLLLRDTLLAVCNAPPVCFRIATRSTYFDAHVPGFRLLAAMSGTLRRAG